MRPLAILPLVEPAPVTGDEPVVPGQRHGNHPGAGAGAVSGERDDSVGSSLGGDDPVGCSIGSDDSVGSSLGADDSVGGRRKGLGKRGRAKRRSRARPGDGDPAAKIRRPRLIGAGPIEIVALVPDHLSAWRPFIGLGLDALGDPERFSLATGEVLARAADVDPWPKTKMKIRMTTDERERMRSLKAATKERLHIILSAALLLAARDERAYATNVAAAGFRARAR